MLCYITSRYDTTQHALILHITLCYITSHHAMLHHITSRYVTSHHITLCYITSRYVTSHHITLCYNTSCLDTSHQRSLFLIEAIPSNELGQFTQIRVIYSKNTLFFFNFSTIFYPETQVTQNYQKIQIEKP